MKITLRAAERADRAFVESVFFETQKWIIHELFGWRGEAVERVKFAESYDERNTNIIMLDGEDCGWLMVFRQLHSIELGSIYIVPTSQRQGLGTILITALIDEAVASNIPLALSTAKINPARTLYDRLGFSVVKEDTYKVYMQHAGTRK